MSAIVAVSIVVGLAVSFFGGALLGKSIQSVATEYANATKQIYVKAHSEVSAKLAAVKAEVEKIEAEAKAEEQAVVARIKALL